MSTPERLRFLEKQLKNLAEGTSIAYDAFCEGEYETSSNYLFDCQENLSKVADEIEDMEDTP